MSDLSDEEILESPELIYSPGSAVNGGGVYDPQQPEDGRRAHHNALERKRRDHIKDSFVSMKQAIPSLKGERASRALILKKACDYIDGMKKEIVANDRDIEQIKAQNSQLEAQIQAFETANRVLEQCRGTKITYPLAPLHKNIESVSQIIQKEDSGALLPTSTSNDSSSISEISIRTSNNTPGLQTESKSEKVQESGGITERDSSTDLLRD